MSKVHVINAGPEVIVVHVQGGNGKSVQSSRQLLPGEHEELFVQGAQTLQVASVWLPERADVPKGDVKS